MTPPTGGAASWTERQRSSRVETVESAALMHLKEGSTIINTTSVTAHRCSDHLLDYAATKGAIVAFTRSLAKALVDKGIRVNGVSPRPIWTPIIAATMKDDDPAQFGSDSPMGRAGEPEEIAPSYVFLASDDSSYMTGQVLHPNGGEIVNGSDSQTSFRPSRAPAECCLRTSKAEMSLTQAWGVFSPSLVTL